MAAGILIFVIIRGILGTIAAVIAHNKGRSEVGWFFGGFFLDLVGIIIVAVLPNLKAERARQARIDEENRRLREQLRQERMKGETFRQYSMTRLDVHDNALGLDTRTLTGTTAAPAQLDWSAAGVPPPDVNEAKWFYERQGEAKGPVAAKDIFMLIEFREIGPDTLVWTEGMSGWTPLRQTALQRGPGP